jgi:Zn-dependent protease
MTEKKSKTGVYGLLAKIGTKLLPILGKILKATKVLKFALLAASLGAYAYLWTWKFAVLIIVALYWHEMGHITAAKHMGIKTKGIFFIPILGAVAVTDGNIKSYGQWSYVALAGPVSGLVQTLICCAAYYMTGIPMLAGAAGFIAFINVFNLAPLSMLDGGQVFRAITFSINRSLGLVFLLMSLIAAVFVAVKIHAALFAFLIILGSVDFISEFFKRRSNIKIQAGPTKMKPIQIAYTVAAYALTTIALIAIIKLMAQVPGAELANTFLAS